MSRAVAPFVARIPCVPLAKLCATALLWQKNGETESASHLAHWLSQFAWKKPPFSLWCPENEYSETALPDLREIEPIPGPLEEMIVVPDVAVFTTAGRGTSMGMYRKGDVEIRALGPQGLPLKFGIDRPPESGAFQNWTRCSANPESWMELKVLVGPPCRLDLRYIGAEPMAFVFYVKAGSCRVGSTVLKPKSLQGYSGEASTVSFDEQLSLESTHPHKIQIIPLAGEGCFWNCDFLISYEINSYDGKISFLIN